MSKFLLLLGPSGVGKTSIIRQLRQLDSRFVYISPYVTRSLRDGETDKIPIGRAQIDEMWARGELLSVNHIYDVCYATPLAPIVEALKTEAFPLLDWPVQRIDVVRRAFPGLTHCVYVAPPSVEVLRHRLGKDGRDPDGMRFRYACEELEQFWSSRYAGVYDCSVVLEEGEVFAVANGIYDEFLRALQ